MLQEKRKRMKDTFMRFRFFGAAFRRDILADPRKSALSTFAGEIAGLYAAAPATAFSATCSLCAISSARSNPTRSKTAVISGERFMV